MAYESTPIPKLGKEIFDTFENVLLGLKLIYDKESNCLIAKISGLSYPIRNGIPIMIVEEAKN